jgi:hypothetical protein
MIHANKLFPQALANILAQCKEEEKEKASDPIDHEMVTLIRSKRKKRAHVRLTEREKVQLHFNFN